MGVAGILVAASLLVPEDVATENDITVADVWDYLAHDEWDVALRRKSAQVVPWRSGAGGMPCSRRLPRRWRRRP
jgi:hypothetical protein